MKKNIAMLMAAALAVGLLATGAQARGGGFGGGHGGGFGGGFHGGMMTGRSAFVPGGNRMYRHDHAYGYLGCTPYGSLNGWDQQNGCY